MTHQIVSAEQFWQLMCRWAFYRIDEHRGQIGSTVYHVTDSPESTGRVERALTETMESMERFQGR